MIFACAARDDLVRRMDAGDVSAWRILRMCMPMDVPARVKISERDRIIRAAAMELRIALPGMSDRSIAVLLLAAGRRLATREHLGVECDRLSKLERDILEHRIRDALAWSSLPSLRQLQAIIK